LEENEGFLVEFDEGIFVEEGLFVEE